MARAPVNVLMLPFRRPADAAVQFAIFRRADTDRICWQGLAGGVDDGESVLAAARREFTEETGLPPNRKWIRLQSRATVPAGLFRDREAWGAEVFMVDEFALGVELRSDEEIQLSPEHAAMAWLSFAEASRRLTFDSNRNALWELNERLSR